MYDIIVVENLRFRPSTRKREANVCKNLHLAERFRKKNMRFRGRFHRIRVDGRYIRLQTKTDTCGRGFYFSWGTKRRIKMAGVRKI